jgi:hypothetical protein
VRGRAEVYPAGVATAEPMRPGSYTFADAREATAFVTEAVEALMPGFDVKLRMKPAQHRPTARLLP